MAATIADRIALIRQRDKAPTPNERGNTVYRMFWSTDRYVVDFASDFQSAGWQQFDTDQDASYFGVWVNRGLRLTLTYAEGDWHLVECPDEAHYLAEVRSAIAFYGEGFEAKAIDQHGRMTIYRQDREAMFIK
jgi:hypothetical protein